MNALKICFFWQKLLPILLLLALSGCSIFDADKDKKILQGKREGVFQSSISLNADSGKVGIYDSKYTACNQKCNAIGPDTPVSHIFKSEFSSAFYPINELLILGNKLFIIHPSGVVSAYDKNTKADLWKNSFLKEAFSASMFECSYDRGFLAAHNNIIYIAYGAKAVIAVDSNTGTLIWKQSISGAARGAEIANDTLFVTAADDHVYAMDIHSGKIIWRYIGLFEGVSLFDERKPVIYKHMVLVQNSLSDIIALSAKTGQELWSSSLVETRLLQNSDILSYPVSLTPILDDDILFFTTSDGAIVAVNLNTQEFIWSKALGIRKRVWICGNHIYALGGVNQLISVNKRDGNIAWTADLSSYADLKKKDFTWTPPVLIDNKVIIVGANGIMLVFNASSGALVEERKVLDRIYSKPIADENSLYLISNRGRIMQYSK